MSAWPSISCTERRSQPPASRCVANVWRSVCGLIRSASPAVPPGGGGDFVEALACERLTAEVHEQLRDDPAVHERRAPALEVDPHGRESRAADGNDALL